MESRTAQALAQIHAQYGIYDSTLFSVPPANDIARGISCIPELTFLYHLYTEYEHGYVSELQKRPCESNAIRLTGVARSVDLSFIGGDAVLETGQAKYFVLFEGSLSRSDHLSITVLSCL